MRAEGGVLLACGGMPDHVHLLTRLPQTKAVADVLRVVKTNSSKWMGETFPDVYCPGWQTGYGGFTVSTSGLGEVKAYIANQEEHHRTRTFQAEFRAMLVKHGIEFDERYLWE